MHGRLKVRSTEEERARKKKEQGLKMLAYKAAMSKMQEKRKNDEYDDEMLPLTIPILQRNPDCYTLWNIRRMCVQRKAAATKPIEPDNDETNEKLQAIYQRELDLCESCLVVHPKSYAAWHHRVWTLENCPFPNWQREMLLCTKYLKLDERNFHTWDYRRYVAAKADISKARELDFCTEKIKVNFSNYSSWHYRSLLLPELYPYKGDALPKRPMSEGKLKEELEMVLTAAFTDPNDSSAWFYQRWLLGYSRPALDISAFRCNNEKAVIAFTKPILNDGITVTLFKNDEECLKLVNNWNSIQNTIADTAWFTKLELADLEFDETAVYHLTIDIPEFDSKKLNLKLFNQSLYFVQPPNPIISYTKEVLTELKSQLDSCKSLLELEPDSKWTLLTTALIMRAVDQNLYHEDSLEHLEKLKKVDTMRQGYYEDLASKWILEKALNDWLESEDVPAKLDLNHLNKLTSIGFSQYFTIVNDLLLTKDLELKYHKRTGSLKTFKMI